MKKIGEVASTFNVSCRTLRYYEEIGLLSSIRHEESQYRYYDRASLKRLEEILFLKGLGLSMKEIVAVFSTGSMEKLKTILIDRVKALFYQQNSVKRERDRIEKLLMRLDSEEHAALSDIVSDRKEESGVESHTSSIEEFMKMAEFRKGLDVRIIKLKSCRVAYYRAVGKSPEHDALRVMEEWASKEGLLDLWSTRNFGFNNPSPSMGSEEYGYEVWLTVPQETEPSELVGTKDFSGGLYAVINTGLHNIGENWRSLSEWIKESRDYECGSHQCLEEITSPDWFNESNVQLDLYFPVIRTGA